MVLVELVLVLVELVLGGGRGWWLELGRRRRWQEGAQLGARSEDAIMADQVLIGWGDQHRQAAQEITGRKTEHGGPRDSPGLGELVDQETLVVDGQSRGGDGCASTVAQQLLQALSVVGLKLPLGMQGKAVPLEAQLILMGFVW